MKRKRNWNLSFTEEEFRDVTAENYKSAENSSADVKRHEVALGSIVKMDHKEAEELYKGHLAVAALGCPPQGSLCFTMWQGLISSCL